MSFADDVKVAPVSEQAEVPTAEEPVGGIPEGDLAVAGSAPPRPDTESGLPVAGSQAWEGSLFEGDGDANYAAPQLGASGPVKSGKPSSGNWQMPDWMDDEESADAKLGAGHGGPGRRDDVLEDDGGRSRLVLFGGVGLLVVAVLAAGGVYLLKNKDDSVPAAGKPARPVNEPPPKVQLPPDRALPQFKGRKSRIAGRVADPQSGLSYPVFGKPWLVPTKKNKLGISGWSGQQILVTEKRRRQMWYGQLLTGGLIPTLQGAYKGPESIKQITAMAANGLEANYYGFPHKKAPLASAPLNVGGRKGWVIASYLTYKRAGVKATGEVVATAVIDNGRPSPAVVFVSLPNTHFKMRPDINQFLGQLRVAS